MPSTGRKDLNLFLGAERLVRTKHIFPKRLSLAKESMCFVPLIGFFPARP